MAIDQGETCSCRVASAWVANQRQSGSHKTLSRPGWPDFVFAFHNSEEIGPKMLARISKHTGLTPQDL
ncbi:MAG: type II toxin-antitoxin system HicA family toxin [Burkholderiales bacterium]